MGRDLFRHPPLLALFFHTHCWIWMSIALSEFWTRLVQNGIADASRCKNLAAQFTKTTGSPPDEPSALASFLIQQDVLTKFQAKSLLSDSPQAIRAGNFLIRSDKPVKPLGHWLPVRNIEESRDGYLLRVPLDQLSDARRQWLAAHVVIEAKTLQRFQLSSDSQENVEIFSPLSAGKSLQALTQTQPKVKRDQTISIGIDLAAALTAMHEKTWCTGASELIMFG